MRREISNLYIYIYIYIYILQYIAFNLIRFNRLIKDNLINRQFNRIMKTSLYRNRVKPKSISVIL